MKLQESAATDRGRDVQRAVGAREESASLEAEQSVIGALLLDGSAIGRLNGLRGADFVREEHRLAFQAIRDCVEDDGVVDLVTVADRLRRNGGGGDKLLAYLAAIAQNTPSALHVERYAAMVQQHALRRELAALGADIAQRAQRGDPEEVRQFIEARLATLKHAAKSDLRSLAFWLRDATATRDLPYVLKGVFGMGQIVVVWGAPGSGKTFVIIDMACSIAHGSRWYGRRTRKGIVIYVYAESARAFIANRLAALTLARPELRDADVLIVPAALDLLHAERGDIERILATCRALQSERGQVVLIVVDTLAASFGGGDENASPDMGLYVSNILHIRQETGAAIILVHHCGKDEARGMRGHSVLLGALDAELVIEGGPGDDRILRTGKVRDGDGNADLFAFKLRPVEIGTDQDGDPVTTCVLEVKDDAGTKQARLQRKGAGLGRHQKAALRILQAAGGRMVRTDLAHSMKDEGVPRNRIHDAIGALLQTGILVAYNEVTPAEIGLQ